MCKIKKTATLEDQFWSRVDKTDGCWLWTGCTRQGYGALGYHRQRYDTHRLSWELAYGPIPAGMWVLHRCDVRNCVRPDHLFLGTLQDNNRDMYAKGRYSHIHQPCGEQSGRAKLTDDDVREIRRMYAAHELNQTSIARLFGVNQQSISGIILRKTWTHI